MLAKKSPSFFSARLKTQQGEMLAEGEASIDLSQKSVTFRSSFVPLYPMGTKMEIVRIYEGKEIHRFFGSVFLSDKKLMKLVSVSDELLRGSELCYCEHMDFSATVTPCFSMQAPQKRLFSLAKPMPAQEPNTYTVRIQELTVTQLIFRFEDCNMARRVMSFCEQISSGISEQSNRSLCFLLNTTSELPLRQIEIEITKPLYFGNNPLYIGRFVSLDEQTHHQLSEFLWQYNLAHHKLFE